MLCVCCLSQATHAALFNSEPMRLDHGNDRCSGRAGTIGLILLLAGLGLFPIGIVAVLAKVRDMLGFGSIPSEIFLGGVLVLLALSVAGVIFQKRRQEKDPSVRNESTSISVGG